MSLKVDALNAGSFNQLEREKYRIGYICSTLALLALDAPRFKRQLLKCAVAVREEARRTATHDEKTVLNALSEGFARVPEIAEQTTLPENTVYKVLARLRKNDLVFRTPSAKEKTGRGGDRVSYLYFPRFD